MKRLLKSLTLENPIFKVMDIQAEKLLLIEQLLRTEDIQVIEKIRALLNNEKDEALEASIDRGLSQSKNGETRPHEQVISEIRKRHK